MKMHLPKLPWIIISLITLAFLTMGYLFLNTQKGLTLASELAQQWLPGKLTIRKLKGCLLGPIQIEALAYTSPGTKLSIASGQLDWHWTDLLQGQFTISTFVIDKLMLSIEEKDAAINPKIKKEKFQFPWILKRIQLNSADLKQVLVRYGDNLLTLNGTLAKQWDVTWQLTIPQLNKFIPNSQGQLSLDGKINGSKLSPQFYFSLPKTNLTWKDWQFQQIQGEFHLDNFINNRWFFNLKASEIKNTNFLLSPIHITLSGNLKPFSLQGTLSPFKLDRINDVNLAQRITIPSSEITAKLVSSGLTINFITDSSNADQLSADIQLPHYKMRSWINSKQLIKGNLQLTLKNLNYLSFIPIIKDPQGLINAQLKLSGPLISPAMDLTLSLKKGSTQIPSLGLYLKNINVAFHTEKNVLQGAGQVDSGKGSLTFLSKTRLAQANFLSNIDLKGNNLEISHTRQYKIIASPQLHVQADTHHVAVTGLISFPKAHIKINEDNVNSVALSDDVVFVNQEKKPSPISFTYKNDIKIQLGDDVKFNYQGLRTKVTGALTINQTSDHPILASGELMLNDGEYTYYGQSLTLQPPSSLTFAKNPIDNPNLDITASKNVWVLPPNDTTDPTKSRLGSSSFISTTQTTQAIRATVGIHVLGYLKNPQISLYADPASAIGSQLDILSYLTTGQPSSQLSAGSVQLLLSAASHLGGKQSGFSNLINTAQKKIGLDQLTIGANPIFNPNTNSLEQNTSIIVGKNFSPRLNVSYSLGLLDPISILQINYLLNKHFSLQSTNSNFANGIDLLYKIEKH